MDSYTMDQLTDEVFGHLCTIAIDKCNDKTEKRRAGCGGKAMRKRVLIKNFVSELMRVQNDRDAEDMEDDLNDSRYDCDSSDTSMSTETDSDVSMDFMKDDTPKSDCWLAGEQPLTDHYSEYLGDSLLTCRDGAQGRADNKQTPTSPPDSRLGLYDLFTSVSEGATEGGQPEAATPDVFMHTVPAHGYDSFGTYDLTANYEMENLSLSSLCDMEPSPLQPVRAEASDQLFLALSNGSYSEMKTYTPMGGALPDDVMAATEGHTITDLDAAKENVFGKKRKSDDSSYPSSVSEKRLKL